MTILFYLLAFANIKSSAINKLINTGNGTIIYQARLLNSRGWELIDDFIYIYISFLLSLFLLNMQRIIPTRRIVLFNRGNYSVYNEQFELVKMFPLMIPCNIFANFGGVRMSRIRNVRGIWNLPAITAGLPSANFQITFLNVST